MDSSKERTCEEKENYTFHNEWRMHQPSILNHAKMIQDELRWSGVNISGTAERTRFCQALRKWDVYVAYQIYIYIIDYNREYLHKMLGRLQRACVYSMCI
jgi:hypothetical protein